jgi:hypothetical protein
MIVAERNEREDPIRSGGEETVACQKPAWLDGLLVAQLDLNVNYSLKP